MPSELLLGARSLTLLQPACDWEGRLAEPTPLESAWFDAHPEREYRCRPATELEIGTLGIQAPAVSRLWCIVRRSDLHRAFVSFDQSVRLDRWRDDELKRLFDRRGLPIKS
jgi:hypothetical protein